MYSPIHLTGVNMKFCKDCKHIKAHSVNIPHVCLSPNLPIDLVTGSPKFALCKDMREYVTMPFGEVCGMQGKWFEPKVIEDADLDDLSKIPFGR